jgi:DNA-binding transcriptional MerR regulator
MTTLHPARRGTVDVARETGWSVQQVRKLEREGVLPPVDRTPAGYRLYAPVHVHALRAYRALARALGPVPAKALLRGLRDADPEETLATLDSAHAALRDERLRLTAVHTAASLIATEPVDTVRRDDWMTITDLAAALGVRTSTLRHWDAEGLVVPDRAAPGGARSYSPAQARDARVVQQLRAAGHGIEELRTLMPALRAGHRQGDLESALAARRADVTRRSLALLEAGSELQHLLGPAPAAIGRSGQASES